MAYFRLESGEGGEYYEGMSKKMTDMPKIDRPREKMEKYGPRKLSDAELLAILMRTGTKEKNVLTFSRSILRTFKRGSLLEATFNDLKTVHGLGSAKACEILACFELGRRLLLKEQARIILSPKDVWDRMADVRESKREHFVVFYLDSASREVRRDVVSVGTLNESLVHPREVFESAIRENAAHIIVSHNHPSGNLEPSEEDRRITEKLAAAGDLLGIKLLDHVIVTKEAFRSVMKI